MNWDLIERNWQQFKGTVKARWNLLSDAHLGAIAGRRDMLCSKIQETYGITKYEAEKQVQAFEARNKAYRPKNSL